MITTTSWQHERDCCQFLEMQRPPRADYSHRRPLTPPVTSEEDSTAQQITLPSTAAMKPSSIFKALKSKVHSRRQTSHQQPTTYTRKAYDQTQAPLLRLPAELRNAIFQQVIGGFILHLVTYRQGIHHVTCSGDESCSGCQTRSLMLEVHDMKRQKVAAWTRLFRSAASLLSLLKTCRTIYSEAVGLLYSTNTFDFADLFTFLDFVAAIPPARANQVQHINLSWLFRHTIYACVGFLPLFHRSTWEDVWTTMATLRGLRSLRVQLADQEMDGQQFLRLYWYLDIVEHIAALDTTADVRITIPRLSGVESVPRHDFMQRMVDEIPPDNKHSKQWLDDTRLTSLGPTPSGPHLKCSHCSSLPQRRGFSMLKKRCSCCLAPL